MGDVKHTNHSQSGETESSDTLTQGKASFPVQPLFMCSEAQTVSGEFSPA